jgi:class 3 adenylate cyclase
MNFNLFTPPPSDAWLELPDGNRFWLKGRCALGREKDNDVVLALPSVSRHHALLSPTAAGYTLDDLHSSNGTGVNGEMVTRTAALRDGDKIKIGDAVLRYRCKRRRPATDAPGDGATTFCVGEMRERECWLLVADVEGYTALDASAGREEALRRLQAWIAGIAPLLENNGGRINSYVGDSIFAFWPGEATKPAQVIAALAAVESWRSTSPLAFRLAVHHGLALFTKGDQGEELHGRDVTFTFQAEKLARKLHTPALLSSTAVASLGLEGRCESFGRMGIEGMSDIIVCYALPADLGKSARR